MSIDNPIAKILSLKNQFESNFDLKSFPTIASQLLSELEFNYSLAELEEAVSQWLLDLKVLPKQVNLYNDFGEPSITIFHNDKFSIDLYFWRKNDTLIHSHGFRGAFKVLFGQSLHEEFKVEMNSSSGQGVVSSKVNSCKLELLKVGDTRAILPGLDLVHRVLHLDNPTVTLCVRTVNDTELCQWHHLSSGISYQQQNISELTIKQILYFQFLFNSDQMKAFKYLDSILDAMSDSSQLSLYLSQFRNEFALGEEVIEVLINKIKSKLEKTDWYTKFEEHYINLDKNLYESYASKGSLKLLAHAVNCGYSKEELNHLNFSLDEVSLFAKELMLEGPIFNEVYYSEQQKKISEYIKEIS